MGGQACRDAAAVVAADCDVGVVAAAAAAAAAGGGGAAASRVVEASRRGVRVCGAARWWAQRKKNCLAEAARPKMLGSNLLVAGAAINTISHIFLAM